MARDAERDGAVLRAILERARAGQHAEAAGLAHGALAEGLEHPLVLNVAALGLEQQGRIDEAVRLLRRAVQIAPRDAAARNALGLSLLQMLEPREALEQFDAVLELDAGIAHAHANRGHALRALGAPREAEASYRRTLELDPAHALALAGLANLAAHRGAYGEARASAEKALAAAPGLPDALLSLAVADLGEGHLERAERSVRTALNDGRLPALARARAHGVLGDILDAAQQTEAAFAAYTTCNDGLRGLYSGRFASAFDQLREMTASFPASLAERWRAARDSRVQREARAHVFVLGFPRSGTTLLNSILVGHPQVVVLEHYGLLVDAAREFPSDPRSLESLARAPPAVLERLRAAYWIRVASAGADVKDRIFVDGSALNSLQLPLVARLFPDARILLACRDPRDAVLSAFRNRFAMSAPGYELLTLDGGARYYGAVMDFIIRLTSLLKFDILLVRHEDLISEFKREMRRICEALALEWHPGMGDFSLRARDGEERAPTEAEFRRGLGTEGIGQWRRYRAHLEPVLPILEPWVQRFDYGA